MMFSARPGRDSRSVIAAGCTLTGSVTGADEVVIAGTLIGTVQARSVILEAGGRLDGEIQAEVVTVSGALDGFCTADALTVTATGALRGEARYKRLEVAPGAVLEARCTRRGDQAPPSGPVVEEPLTLPLPALRRA